MEGSHLDCVMVTALASGHKIRRYKPGQAMDF
jgi:hypothetical protein